MPGCSTRLVKSSSVHLNASQFSVGSKLEMAYILPPILKTRWSSHTICSVVCGRDKQCSRIQSIPMVPTDCSRNRSCGTQLTKGNHRYEADGAEIREVCDVVPYSPDRG